MVLLLGFHLVFSFGVYSSVTSFCLPRPFHFFVFGKLVFPSLREVACGSPQDMSCLVTRAICSRGTLCVVSWSSGPFCRGLLTTVGGLVSVLGSHSGCFQAQPCAEGVGHWYLGCLGGCLWSPRKSLGLVLAHLWVERSHWFATCDAGNPGASVAFWQAGLVPDVASCRAQGDLGLVTLH